MREHPILMTTESVKGILDGYKTMTRRTYSLNKINEHPNMWKVYCYTNENGFWAWFSTINGIPYEQNIIRSPYGQTGSRLWLRETFCLENDCEYGYTTDELEQWAKDRPIKTEGDDTEGHYHLIPHYRATEPEPGIVPYDRMGGSDKTIWKPSIFMPKWASRITLEITGIRVERLQDITEEDAEAEGTGTISYTLLRTETGSSYPHFRDKFIVLWDSINTKRHPWANNPWVWVIEFRGIK